MKHFEVGTLRLPKVFLGTSPFMGAGQFGERAFGYYERFYEHPENMLPLMERAVDLGWGIQPFVLPSFMGVLARLRERVGEYPLVFSAGIKDLRREMVEVLKFPGAVICLHASISDSVGADALEVHFQEIRAEGSLPGVVTHSPGTTVAKVQGTSCELIMAPINRLGWAMEPDPHASLGAIEDSKIPIMAKKALAAGRIPPQDGFTYVAEHQVSAVCVGAVSEEEIEEDNGLLQELGFI